MTDCSVCTDPYAYQRKQVPCANCAFSACSRCVKTFLTTTNTDPHCMNCRHVWDRAFLDTHFPRSWIEGDLKHHRQKLLWDRERSLMPATMDAVEVERETRGCRTQITTIKTQLVALDNSKARVQRALLRLRYRVHCKAELPDIMLEEKVYLDGIHQVCTLCPSLKTYQTKPHTWTTDFPTVHKKEQCSECRTAAKAELDAIRAEYKTLGETEIALEEERRRLEFRVIHGRFPGTDVPVVERRAFVAACPAESCRGFLSTAYKCGLCAKQFCSDCRELKSEGHTCDPALVETIKAIVKHSHPCPSCGTAISKVDGCDQMYCTLCFTAFSYITGKVVTGVIHNPHYYERMRKLNGGVVPRQAGAGAGAGAGVDPCANLLDVLNELRRQLPKSLYGNWTIAAACRIVSHLIHVELLTLATGAVNNVDLRVRFLLNDFDEKRFKQLIQQRERTRQKELEIRAAYELFIAFVLDTFGDTTNVTAAMISGTFVNQVEELVNAPLRSIAARYQNRVRVIDIIRDSMPWFNPKVVKAKAKAPVGPVVIDDEDEDL